MPSGIQPHRKRIKHWHEPGHAHELTFSCYRRLPLLTSDDWRACLSRSIEQATARHGYRLVAFVYMLEHVHRLVAFVYMLEHVHLLVFPESEAGTISALLKAIKQPYSCRVKQALAADGSPLLAKLTVRQRPGVMTFRYWQEGPGYDRNITTAAAAWACIDYIHANPVRRGLCDRGIDWRWSSARWFLDPKLPQDPDLPPLQKLPVEFFQE